MFVVGIHDATDDFFGAKTPPRNQVDTADTLKKGKGGGGCNRIFPPPHGKYTSSTLLPPPLPSPPLANSRGGFSPLPKGREKSFPFRRRGFRTGIKKLIVVESKKFGLASLWVEGVHGI